ncbi:hypothetical protein RCL1_000757 [Eukaryota sp. TZLM3-RCL]
MLSLIVFVLSLFGVCEASIRDQLAMGFVQNGKQLSSYFLPIESFPARMLRQATLVSKGTHDYLFSVVKSVRSYYAAVLLNVADTIIPSYQQLPHFVHQNKELVARIVVISVFASFALLGLYLLISALRFIRRNKSTFNRVRLVLLALGFGFLLAKSQTKPIIIRSSSTIAFNYSIVLFIAEILLIKGFGTLLLSLPLLNIVSSLVFDSSFAIPGPRVLALLVPYLLAYSFLPFINKKKAKKNKVKVSPPQVSQQRSASPAAEVPVVQDKKKKNKKRVA